MPREAGYNWGLQVKLPADTPYVIAGYTSDTKYMDSAPPLSTTTRNDAGFENCVPGLTKWGIALKHLWVPSESAYSKILTAYRGKSSLNVRLYDTNLFLATAITNVGGAITTFAIAAAKQFVASGLSITLGVGASAQTFVLTADIKIGDTAATFTSATPAVDHAAGEPIQVGATAAKGREGTVCVTKFEASVDMKEVYLDVEFSGQGPVTDR